jgi:hypothetical protein
MQAVDHVHFGERLRGALAQLAQASSSDMV